MCSPSIMAGIQRGGPAQSALARAGVDGATGSGRELAQIPIKTAFITDLTHTLSPNFPTYDGKPGIAYDKTMDIETDGYSLYILTIDEHTGTHIDAPLHFSAGGIAVDAIPVEALVAPLCVIDIRAKADADPDAELTPDDIATWTGVHGPIPDGACVAMLSGWEAKIGGPAFRGEDADGVLHFPGFHPEAAAMLLAETRARAIAVDTLSLDPGPSQDFATHAAWLPAGRYGIEALAALDTLPPAGATLIVGAPKIAGGTGGQARIFALT